MEEYIILFGMCCFDIGIAFMWLVFVMVEFTHNNRNLRISYLAPKKGVRKRTWISFINTGK